MHTHQFVWPHIQYCILYSSLQCTYVLDCLHVLAMPCDMYACRQMMVLELCESRTEFCLLLWLGLCKRFTIYCVQLSWWWISNSAVYIYWSLACGILSWCDSQLVQHVARVGALLLIVLNYIILLTNIIHMCVLALIDNTSVSIIYTTA